MNLETLTTAGTLALATALMFLVSARAWHALTRMAMGAPIFRDSTMREAAQRFRDETDRLGRNHAAYLATTLIASIIFAAALGFDLDGLYRGYPTWQLGLVVVLLASFSAFVIFKLATTLVKLAAARFQRDASIAIGHQLLRFASAHGSVFHDVDVGQNIVDHVLVGHDGAYAIHVVAVRNRGRRAARLSGEELHLGKQIHSLEGYTNNAHRLSAAFSKLAGHRIPVRSVVAIPGWDVDSQHGNKHLLVNERTLPMLTGWKSRSDYLMNEDVAAIVEYLTDRGKRD